MSGPVASAKHKILKPVSECFDAVINKDKITKFFVSTASADMTEGAVLVWSWAEFNASGNVTIGKIEPNKSITFNWLGGGFQTTVVITFEESINGQATLVKAEETGFPLTIEGANAACGQTGGWMHFILSMKAYLEHGINLREGGVWTLN